MNILHYNTMPGWRGGEQQGLYLIEGLNRYPVTQYSMGLPDNAFLERTAPFVKQAFPMPSRGELNPSVVFSLIKVIKKEKINIVHTHTTHAHSLALQAKHFYNNFTLIIHRRVDFAIKNNALSLYKYKSEKVDKIIAVSECIKQLLIGQGVPADKIELIYDGVNPDRLKADHAVTKKKIRNDYGIDPETLIFGNIAALTGNKDHITLLRALHILMQEGIGFKLFILGDGEEKENILKEAKQLGLEHHLILPGYRTDLENFMGAFDIYVNSSQNEGLGTSIIDALANGIPVVATHAGGVPEILGESEFGLLVEKKNPHALAEGIKRMIKEPLLKESYEKKGRARADQFSVESMVKKSYNLYQKFHNKET